MTTIAEKLTIINNAFKAIKQAIINKGGTTSGDVTTYAQAIRNIPSGGGSTPVINSLNVTPTTSSQTITASGGVDGYSPINVSAVTSSIDNNITAGNIKKDVTILGVTGSYEGSGGGSTINNQNKTFIVNGTYTADPGYTGLGTVTVNVSGSTPVINSLNITPTTSNQTITASGGVDGYSPITVSAVTSSIDSNITAGNIKKGVTILDVTGTYEGSGGGSGSTKYGASIDSLLGDASSTGVLQKPDSTSSERINLIFSNITNIAYYALAYKFSWLDNIETVSFPNLTYITGSAACISAFYSCKNLTSVNLGNLTSIDGPNVCDRAFYKCSNLTSLDLSNLTTIHNSSACAQAFYGCSSLTSLDLSNLTTINGISACESMLYGCESLAFLDLSGLTTINGSKACYTMLSGCLNLGTVNFANLTTINGSKACYGMFNGDEALENISFPKLTTSSFGSSTDQFNFMFSTKTGKTNGCIVHFPSNLESTISELTGYPTFGGNATYISIAFDLPATS